jgi:hypothetical protein
VAGAMFSTQSMPEVVTVDAAKPPAEPNPQLSPVASQ